MTAMVKLSGMHGVAFVDPETVAGLFESSVTDDDGGPMCDLAFKGGLLVGLGMSAEEAHAALFPGPEAPTLKPCGSCGMPDPCIVDVEEEMLYALCNGCGYRGQPCSDYPEVLRRWNGSP